MGNAIQNAEKSARSTFRSHLSSLDVVGNIAINQMCGCVGDANKELYSGGALHDQQPREAFQPFMILAGYQVICRIAMLAIVAAPGHIRRICCAESRSRVMVDGLESSPS